MITKYLEMSFHILKVKKSKMMEMVFKKFIIN